MPWSTPRPQASWRDLEWVRFHQEQFDRFKFGAFSWTPPALSALANSSTAYVLSQAGPDITSSLALGLDVGDPVSVSPPSILPAQVSLNAFAGPDSLTIVIVNPTAAPVTPPAGVWGFFGMVA